MSAFLNVPYTGQVGNGADIHGNDCGPASVADVIKYYGIACPTVDALFDEVQPSGDKYTWYADLTILLSKRGLVPDYKVGVSTCDLFWILASKRVPVIVLVRYGLLESVRPNTFKGSHFMVVIGMDIDDVYVNDPLNKPTSGACVKIPIALFEAAWSSLGEDNPQRSCLIPPVKAGVVIETPPIKLVKPRDPNGCNVRRVPGDLSEANKVGAIPRGNKISIYLERDGWGKISASEEKWVCMEYTVPWS